MHSVTLAQVVNRSDLMPTPSTMDHLPARTPEKLAESKERSPAGYSNLREKVVNDLLPTPMTTEAKHGDHPSEWNRNSTPLGTIVHGTDFGRFAEAIERWEAVNGPAPAPTEAYGDEGKQRLSARFAEWMMGLPAGWITDCEITRNEQLKACGNGVVPQQATLAITELIRDKHEFQNN
jgi:DNA (cytosine-5)-methyltransferase 1